MNKIISFIILTWNSERTIAECLQSIIDQCSISEIDYEIFIVDNGSTDKTIGLITSEFHNLNIQLTLLKENKGTTLPRNIALAKSKGDIICIIDSDAVLYEGRLDEIVLQLDDSSVGIIAPKLFLPDGTIQNSVKKFPSLFSKLVKIPKILFKIKTRNLDFYTDFPFKEKIEVDTAISACWFFRRDLLTEIGYLDEKIFYSPEDIDYCLRVKKSGKKIIYDPFFSVLHYTQQITHKKFFSKIALTHFFDLMYYFFKHKYVNKPKI